MNRATKPPNLPSLTADLFTPAGVLMDNLFADLSCAKRSFNENTAG